VDGIFALVCLGLFWWAVIVGFKTLYRRLVGGLAALLGNDRSLSEHRRLSKAIDDDQPATIDSLTDEMETALARERAGASELLAQSSERHALLGDTERAVASWDDKARAAIDMGRDDLARAALVERARVTLRADGLRDELARIDELLGGYQVDIRSLQARLGDAYRRRSFAAARIDRAERGAVTRQLLGDEWEEAQPDFERLDRAADMAEARLEALSLGAPRSFGRRVAAPTSDLSPLSAPLDPLIEQELAALKAKLDTDRLPPAAVAN